MDISSNGDAVRGRNKVNVNHMHAAILREQSEPEDGFEALPTPWLMCMLALALMAGWYLGAYTANFSPTRLDGDVMTTTMSGPNVSQKPVTLDPKLMGKRIYNNCMACHQADGKGLAGQFPPLAQSEWVVGNPQALAKILLHGLQGEVDVLGKRYNGVMPAWQRFSDADIAAVLTYIRSAFGNASPPIEPEIIANIRETDGILRGAWSQTELRQAGVAP